ncbi:hypothetical protein [Mycobacterium sp. IS-3022]|uniref:hypothetical protein n=1 Tax=Mycobacterium sp. IS-3022 TaxID=1772277 RepID=UPI00074175B1|nr:hypothetical protein [Mycobacterium sp. IS-3022]KUH99264.1 hypothetical protein AU188_11430 [Mycobacterium sp. IS-3022]
MTEPLGGQTVDFVKISSDGPRDHLNIPAKVETVTPVPGCLLRTLSATETDQQLANRAVVRVRCTVRPDLPVTTTMTANDYLRYEGQDYAVVGGSQLNRDLDGVVDHVVIEAERSVA